MVNSTSSYSPNFSIRRFRCIDVDRSIAQDAGLNPAEASLWPCSSAIERAPSISDDHNRGGDFYTPTNPTGREGIIVRSLWARS